VDGSLLLWDISNEQPKGYPVGRPLVSSSEGSGDAAISPELDWTVLEADGRLTLWDLRSGLPAAAPLSGGPDATINDLVFGPNGRQVAAAYDGMLFVWNVSDQNVAAVLEGSSAGDTALAFNPDGTILAAGSGDGSISLWDLQEQVLLDEPLPGMGDSIVDLTFSPKGDLLAAATYEGTVQIWDVARRAPLGDPIQLFSAFSLAFNAEQSLLAIGTGDGAVVLVDVQKREQIGEPLSGGAYYAIHSLTFSPNGQTLVFSDESGIINFWNVESRTRSFSLGLGFSGLAHDLVFSADGLGLYSVDNFGDVLYWNLDPETWITHACERAGRNLSAEEWSNYLPFNPEYHKTCSQWP
jgi:WD40 repeat protein